IGRVLFVGTPVTDMGPGQDQGRATRVTGGLLQSRSHGPKVVAVYGPRLPPIGLEALLNVLGETVLCGTIQADLVLVIEVDQVPQLQVPRQRGRFARDPLHEVAIAHDPTDPIVDQRVPRAVETRS